MTYRRKYDVDTAVKGEGVAISFAQWKVMEGVVYMLPLLCIYIHKLFFNAIFSMWANLLISARGVKITMKAEPRDSEQCQPMCVKMVVVWAVMIDGGHHFRGRGLCL